MINRMCSAEIILLGVGCVARSFASSAMACPRAATRESARRAPLRMARGKKSPDRCIFRPIIYYTLGQCKN